MGGVSKNFEYYIGNDTGISHIAMLVCDKVVIHHGGGGLGRFFPWPDHKKESSFTIHLTVMIVPGTVVTENLNA